MAVRYKVVTRDRKSYAINSIPSIAVRTYEKNKIVRAIHGSFGIFTFKRRYQADNYIKSSIYPNNYFIIRVKPIGKGKNIKKIIFPEYYQSAEKFSNPLKYKDYLVDIGANGVIGYPAVEVLD